MKQGVIFDMDGVLVETEHFYFKRRMQFFDELKIEPPTRRIQDFVGLTNDMIWNMLVPKNKERRRALKEEYVNFSKKHEVCFSDLLNPSVRELFNKLKDKKVKIAIASSSEKKYILEMLEQCKLGEYADFVISGEECKQSKPDPEIYIKAVKALDLSEAEVLAVEDSTLGIRAAKSAGITVCALVQKNYDIDQSEADYEINDLMEILTQL
ncbi:HAD family hydrolase [Wukongibacter sp. M2B1]|uniref:HAD family hydrolase n=1 Tax=Wukongibacter sp. M2B1 TaxID=3088895 RepID=UPI003D7964ED